MVTILVMSMNRFSGKTALCLGLARKFAADGLSVGYFKPVSLAIAKTEGHDVDTTVMKQALALTETPEVLAPVVIDGEALEWVFSGKIGDLRPKVAKAFETVSAGKDVLVCEGLNGLAEGCMIDLDNSSLAEILGGRCLLVMRSSTELMADEIIRVKRALGERLLGVIINGVPRGMSEFVSESLVPFVSNRGVKVYAALPEDRMLMSASVSELVERLGGTVIAGQEHMDELVENVMVGAMSVENALNYFRRKPNKAVITGGDRPDIQLAALETSTKCIILTGNLHPNPLILGRAEELGVPVVMVQQDTLTAVELVEQVFSEVRFHQDKKIRRFHRMLDAELNYEELKRDLGL